MTDLNKLEQADATPENKVVEPTVTENPENQSIEQPPVEGIGVETTPQNKSEIADTEKKEPNFQHRLQTFMDVVKEHMPAHEFQMMKADANARVRGVVPEEPPAQPIQQPPQEPGQTYENMYDMPISEVQKMMDASFEKGIQSHTATQERQVAEKKYAQEVTSCDKALNDMIKEGEFTQEERDTAYGEIMQYGINIRVVGNYAMATNLMMKELGRIHQNRQIQERAGQAEIAASEKQQGLLNTIQPEGGAAPTVTAKTEQDKHIERIRSLRSTDMSDLES